MGVWGCDGAEWEMVTFFGVAYHDVLLFFFSCQRSLQGFFAPSQEHYLSTRGDVWDTYASPALPLVHVRAITRHVHKSVHASVLSTVLCLVYFTRCILVAVIFNLLRVCLAVTMNASAARR